MSKLKEFGAVDEFEPVEFKSRREYDPQAEEIARLARRQAIKQRLARLKLAAQRQTELQAQRRRLDVQLDALASQHEERMQDVQDQLATVEKRLVSALVEGRPADGDDERERRNLLEQIDNANHGLQSDLKAIREKIPAVEKALVAIRAEASQWQASQRDLWERDVANPELFKKYIVANNKYEWCARRCKALGNRMEEIQDEIAKNQRWQREQDGISYQREIDRWQLLLDDCRACLTDASAESSAAASEAERLRQEIISE